MIKKSTNPYEMYYEASEEEMLQALKESPFPYITERYFNNNKLKSDILKEMIFIDPRIINNIFPSSVSEFRLVASLTEDELLQLIEKEANVIWYIPDNLRKSEAFLREAYKRNNHVYDILVDMKRDADRQDDLAWQNTVDWYNDENEAGFHFTSCWDFCIWPEDLKN